MTAAVYRTTQSSLSIPHTQNTAPVLEFNCLYTHDIRRKQKRWQDGFLRFHTFNKRVMVYDVPRNFIGDAHWKADEAVQDGDEVTLEKDGVLVQVAESVGRTETDLSELRRSKNQGSSEHGSSPMKGLQTPVVAKRNGVAQKQGTQLKHRSLNALLGTPKGPLGKAALPAKSPYEERQANAENEEWVDGRPAKRRRFEQSTTRSVTRTAKPSTVAKETETPLWARTADAAKQRNKAPVQGKPRAGTSDAIELSDDGEEEEQRSLRGSSNDALAPSSSPAKATPAAKKQRAKPPVRSSSPAFQTQKAALQRDGTTEKRMPVRDDTAREDGPGRTNEPEIRSVEPSAKRDFQPAHDSAASKAKSIINRTSNSRRDVTETENVDKTGQTLRMTARPSKKKTLLCHDQLKRKSARVHSANTETAMGRLSGATSQDEAIPKLTGKSQRKLLEERLAKIQRKSFPTDDERPLEAAGSEALRLNAVANREHSNEAPGEPSAPPPDDLTSLAELDQMIMPPDEARPPIHPPLKQDRQLRKVVSDVPRPSAQKRAPRAPLRFMPSPSKRAEKSAVPALIEADRPSNATSMPPPPPRAKAKKPIQRSVSLNTTANGTSAVIFSKPFQTPKAPAAKAPAEEKAPNPWSREAFDLFTWRPPGWDEERWCAGESSETAPPL